jgi:hypothetical protein
MRLRCPAAWGLALVWLTAAGAGAEVRQVEAVGAVPLSADVRPQTPLRDLAVRRALNDAVRRVAVDLIPDLDPEEAGEFLPEALGDEPFAYTTRFRIIEDRGEVPALYSEDPEVEFEYVVLVEAHIDSDRVEKRLGEAGLLAGRAPRPARQDLLLIVEDPPDFAAYAALRRVLLEDVGVESALPVEMERRRAVIRIRASGGASQLLEDLLRAAPPELVISPIDAQNDVLTLRVSLDRSRVGEAPGEFEAGPGGGSARD